MKASRRSRPTSTSCCIATTPNGPVSATEASAGDLSNQINHALAKKVKVTHNKIGR